MITGRRIDLESKHISLRNQVISEVDLLELLNVEQQTLDNLRRNKGLPYIRLSSKARVYLTEDVLGWLKNTAKNGVKVSDMN
jgi:hypothetical protein